MRLIPLRIRRLIYVLLTIFINFSLSEFIDYSDIGGDVGRSSTASQPIGGCSRTSDCIEQVRRIAAETGRFWFGDPWQFNCAAHNRNKIVNIFGFYQKILISLIFEGYAQKMFWMFFNFCNILNILNWTTVGSWR